MVPLEKRITSKSSQILEFHRRPIIPGPLSNLNQIRHEILKKVILKTQNDFLDSDLEDLLGESLYLERMRLKSESCVWVNFRRYQNDQRLWNDVYHSLLRPGGEVDLNQVLKKTIEHFAEEIAGHFSAQVYEWATHAVPWGFSWLLNAASVQRFLPWGMTESLQSRLSILGEVSLLQKLSRRGTLLLVPTHQSNIDSVLIGYVIYLLSLPPFAYGAGLNLFSNPLLSFFMNRLGAYKVDRKKKNLIYRSTLKNYSTEILTQGIHSIFFPGGGRSRSGAIEKNVKLGLLGTALDAQIEKLRQGVSPSAVYIVPMVMSYHFVLEAKSLIEHHLLDVGKHKYMDIRDESWQPIKIINFFWKFFSSQSNISIRIGRPMDVFGNLVDDEGHSIGPQSRWLNIRHWLTTAGHLDHEPQRDREYTRELGNCLVKRFHHENTVLNSHLVAFSFFESLRYKYRDFDLFRFLRLTLPQRSLFLSDFLLMAEKFYQKLMHCSDRGQVFVSEDLFKMNTQDWVKEGVRQLGCLHNAAVIKMSDDVIWSEDLRLLYYYRNRLSGYGLSLLSQSEKDILPLGVMDEQGFLA